MCTSLTITYVDMGSIPWSIGLYLARRSETWSVIWPRVFAVPRISLRSLPAQSSPTFPASSRICRMACSPASPATGHSHDITKAHRKWPSPYNTIRVPTVLERPLDSHMSFGTRHFAGWWLPGWALGSLSQLLAWFILESMSAKALFMASVSFKESKNDRVHHNRATIHSHTYRQRNKCLSKVQNHTGYFVFIF